MPLRSGCSVEDHQENIKQMIGEGMPRNQAVAAAYDHYYRKCGKWLFVPGWVEPRTLTDSLGMREIRPAIAFRKELIFVGKHGEPKLKIVGGKRADESKVLGFAVKLEGDDEEQLMGALRPIRWERSSTRAVLGSSGKGLVRMMLLMQPKASTLCREECAAQVLYKNNVRDFWTFE